MKETKSRQKLNNRGAALVTVIVVIAFVSVMVTILMYSAGINYYMKTTDMKIKNNFYATETPLEQLRGALVEMTSDAYEDTCNSIMMNYAVNAKSLTGDVRYKSVFVEAFRDKWNARKAIKTDEEFVKSLVSSDYASGLSCTGGLELHETKGYVVLKGVKMSYVKDGYESVIETDYIIKAPDVDMDLAASATIWDPADTDHAKAAAPKKLDLTECVNYYNWVKK